MRSKIAYPYTIKPVDIPAGSQTNCTQAAFLEFLRIECLLRSETVRKLYMSRPREVWPMYETETTKAGRAYRKKPQPRPTMFEGDELEAQYDISYGWHVLDGAHHKLLEITTPPEDAVVDLQELARQKPADVRSEDYLLLNDARYICLRFNVTVPFYVLKAALKEQYDKRQTEVLQQHKPVTVKPSTWLTYLRWHDWHTIDFLSAGQIVNKEKVFGVTVSTSAIEQAFRKVPQVIKCAETKNWPPPAKFLH